jgi:hypothetical protein
MCLTKSTLLPATNMLDIPELLWETLSHLDDSSLLSCCRVCKNWHEPATLLLYSQVRLLECLGESLIPQSTLDVIMVCA